ncbi:spermidine/putrescine ABC transporter substrate-binding protein [Streptomyces sp. ME18-1-4]|uniref:polyamine ABC transporter substrate-binding protein n=1 Tax=Streptomyces sp. ME18-1-4 TaxID=3028685 RepID=UPI0029A46D66|nr:spermidine/putrescine ABC transporter substrate-binding protein [Streptomyces sp. ME18-1-4]MDX3243365.1 spermidine/putrescine ABC transporter substrate-binding protein [Streptomyces sp. ME18-1-4]
MLGAPRFRHVSLAAAAAALALVLSACSGEDRPGGSGPAASASLDREADLSKQRLTVSNWDGYLPEDLPARFKSAVGPSVTVAKHTTNEEIVAKLTASADSGIDVAFVSGQYAQALAAQGLLEPIHHDLVPHLANLDPLASRLAHDKGNVYSVPYTWGTTGLCYRKDLVGRAPDSWNDLLKPRPAVKKKITMLKTERWLFLPAQKALGYSVNTTDEQQLARVKELLLTAKKGLLAYDDTTFGDRLKSGETALAEAWDGWCPTDDERIGFVVPKEGSDLWTDTMVVLKSSKNKEAAHAFINYVLDAKVHSWVASNIFYKVPNDAAMAEIDPALLKRYPALAMTPEQLIRGESVVDVGDASTAYTRIVTDVTAG